MRDRRDAVRLFAMAGAAILGLPWTLTSARAQHVPLAELLPRLILSDITLDSPPAPAGVPGLGVPQGFTT